MKKLFLYITLILIFDSCNKTGVNIVSNMNLPVVESYLIAGGPIVVKLSLPVAVNEDATNPTYINDQKVIVYINDVPTTLNYIGNGIYQDTTNLVKEGSTYKLNFNYNGTNVTATTVVPIKPSGFTASANTISIPQFGNGFTPGSAPTFPSPIVYNWTNNDQSYYFLAAKCIEPILTSISSDTTGNRPRFSRPPTQGNTASLSFYSFPYYGAYHIYLYKANVEYAALYKSSGTNSLNITNPITNVQNGFGIFTSLGVDSLNLVVTK
jgi:hypothetical protein